MTPSLPYLPPEVVVRLVHRDSYPELWDSHRRQAVRVVPARRRLRPIPFGAVRAKLANGGLIGAIAGRVARLNPARGH
jgi:hypothetical protein